MKRLLFKTLAVSILIALLAFGYFSLPNVSPLNRNNPRTTALMELRDEEYRRSGRKPVRQHLWVSHDAISDHLKKAIVISEDASFFSHKGVDLQELKEAIREDWEKRSFKRGASTITMQLARNLYLDLSKNPIRKLREIVIAWQLEQALPKRRIFELYLNIVEWGPGIYGAGAASQHYFSRPASDLDKVEAATLAALLPNPRNPRDRDLLFRRNLILTRMAQIGYMDEEELKQAKNNPLFPKGGEVVTLPETPQPVLDAPGESYP